VAQLKDGVVTTFDVSPGFAGLAIAKPEDLKGGDAKTNAEALRGVLDGAKGAYRDVVIYNAAGSLIVAGKAKDLKEGAMIAADAIDSGKANDVLARWAAITNEAAS